MGGIFILEKCASNICSISPSASSVVQEPQVDFYKKIWYNIKKRVLFFEKDPKVSEKIAPAGSKISKPAAASEHFVKKMYTASKKC